MASTTALFTGLSGLAINARQLDVIGNNIANVNTTAYKSNRMVFSPAFSRNFSLGTAPSSTTGGTNPRQVGLGASVSGTQRNFNNGTIAATGVPTDVAIEGDGFFIVDVASQRYFTRAGSFQLNQNNDLVSIDGGKVMGFGVDAEFEIVQGNLQEINLPVGTLTLAEATQNVIYSGNLNASGEIATSGSVHTSRAFYTDAGLTTLVPDATWDMTVPGNDLYIDDGAGGAFLALEGGAGTMITISGVEKGGQELGERTFAFSATAVPGADDFGATLGDYMEFLQDSFGLDQSVISGQTLGGNVSLVAGQIVVTGNEGTVQNLEINTADMVATNAGAGINQPFVFSNTLQADGESVRTSFVVYDSLGSPLTIDLTMVLQDTTPGVGTTWEFIAESRDNDDLSRVLGLGVVQFDETGAFANASNDAFSITRANGAVSPLTVTMAFNSGTDSITALTDSSSTLAAVFQDGSAIGTLANFAIGEDGVISGAFTNGLVRTIGQIAIAKFANPGGLVDAGGNLFTIGPNSGDPLTTAPLEFGAGRLLSGALEQSNVDLSQEFINMILASTGYSAASRVITTSDELIDQLLLLGR